MHKIKGAADKNTFGKNDAQKYNNSVKQDQFNNQLSKVTLGNNALDSSATNSYNSARDQDAFIGNVASSAATTYAANNAKKKKEV